MIESDSKTGANRSGDDASNNSGSGKFKIKDGRMIEIRDVWASNLDEEMAEIRKLIETHPYVAMDTEFPGIVAHPETEVGATDTQYQTLRCNVNILKLIQLGLSFTDGEGSLADGCTCWQFNFKFSLVGDIYAQDSIELLKASGIDFQKFETYGIDIQYFGELMMMSGLVINDDIKWTSFHSSFDFGYLLKTLIGSELPPDEGGFMELLHIFFPNVYDIKYMMASVEGLYGGLSSIADQLKVDRIGPMHQAGSDSLLTAQTFFGLIESHMNGACDDSRFNGELFGIGSNHTKYSNNKQRQYGVASTNASSVLVSSGSSGNVAVMSNITTAAYAHQSGSSVPSLIPRVKSAPFALSTQYPSGGSYNANGYAGNFEDISEHGY